MTSSPLTLRHSASQLYLNVDGLSANARLRVELLDRNGAGIPDYSGAQAALIKTSGLRVKVDWQSITPL